MSLLSSSVGVRIGRYAGRRAIVPIAACIGLAACGGAPEPDPGPPVPIPSPHHTTTVTPSPPARTVTVSGTVTDAHGEPVSLAVLTFASAGGREISTISRTDGSYQAHVPAGVYQVSCSSFNGDCGPANAGGAGTATEQIGEMTVVDFVVSGGRSFVSPTPEPRPAPPTPEPPRRASSLAQQCRAQGYTVCGHVTQHGSPVAGAIIEAKFQNQNQTTTTNEEGIYGLKLQIGAATLLCEGTPKMMDYALPCSPVNEPVPVTVSINEAGRIVDFSVED